MSTPLRDRACRTLRRPVRAAWPRCSPGCSCSLVPAHVSARRRSRSPPRPRHRTSGASSRLTDPVELPNVAPHADRRGARTARTRQGAFMRHRWMALVAGLAGAALTTAPAQAQAGQTVDDGLGTAQAAAVTVDAPVRVLSDGDNAP